MASTVLPNGIIIPEKYSRDWYNDLYHNWQELDNLLAGGGANDGTLTIQKNGSTVGTFSANQATDETVNITVPTKTSDLTNDSGFITSDDTKIPLAGSNAISGDLIPSTDGTVNLGGSSYQWNNAYIKSLTINGVACGNILTHNASEFVPVTGGAVLTGTELYKTTDSDSITVGGGSTYAKGGSITCVGKDSILRAGAVWLLAEDGTYHARLTVDPDGTATLDNNGTTKNLAMAEDVIPRSGGSVITGDVLAKTTNDSNLLFSGGTGWGYGANISLYGKDSTTNAGVCLIRVKDNRNDRLISLQPSGQFDFGADFAFNSNASLRIGSSAGTYTVLSYNGVFWTNANHLIPLNHSVIDLGWSANAWKDCYLTNSPIVVSDARAKTQTQDVDDRLLDAWANVEIKTYKLVSAVEKKGEKARYHTGYLAQDIQAECEKQGVNAADYGLFCYDEWDEQEEVSEEIETERDGKKVKEKRVIQPKREKGDIYALRYEEALVVECKYLRRCIARLTARIEELEKGNKEAEK